MIYEFNGYTPVIHESAFVHELAAVTGNVIIGEKVILALELLSGEIGVRSILVMDATYRKIVLFMFFPGNLCY